MTDGGTITGQMLGLKKYINWHSFLKIHDVKVDVSYNEICKIISAFLVAAVLFKYVWKYSLIKKALNVELLGWYM